MNDNVDEKDGIMSPMKAIRAKCLDCACGQREEVKMCPVKDCPLYPYRLGRNPNRKKRVMTEEQRKAAIERLAKARCSKNG